MDDLELFGRRTTGFEGDCHFSCRRGFDTGKNGLQAFSALGVPLACDVCCELLVTSEQHYHSTTVPLRTTCALQPTCMRVLRTDRLPSSRVSDRRTRQQLPSASWPRDAQSALTSLGRFTARAVLALFAAVTLVLATASMGHLGPAAAQAIPKGVITLVSQTTWVRSSSAPVRLGLRVRSPVATKDLLVDVALYTEPDQSALASRYEFNTTLTGQLAGLNQLGLTTFSLTSLSQTDGSVEIYVTGSELTGQVPQDVPSGQVFQLPCPQRYGGCEGVYPLQVSLVDVFTGQPVTIDSFTTYLIVVPSTPAPQERLRFSFVLPVGVPPAFTPGGHAQEPRGTLSRIETVAAAEASWPQAPLTLDLYGQTLLALAQTSKHARLVRALVSDAGTLVAGPFSAVNPTRLIRAGLEDDLASQFARSDEVFERVLHTSATAGTYVATTPIGSRGVAELAADGITRIVVPENNLESLPNSGPAAVQWPYTLSAPFRIAGSTIEGLQADPGLAAHLSAPGSPALRTQQLLADLAELYFDSPDYPQERGVALVAPQSWAPDAGFLNATLQGLANSPIIKTVPLGQLFQTVPVGTCQEPPSVVTGCSAAVRSILSPALTGESITVGQVQAARAQLTELSSIIPSDTTTINALDNGILLAETAGLDIATRQTYLSAPLALMSRLGSDLSLPAGRTVTVTSSSARLPLAITSTSRTPLHVILLVSGPNLTSSTDVPVVLKHGTTSFIVRVGTRTSGDSTLQLQLVSPGGLLQLASAQFTIRSTAISGVAIALSAGAGAFLLFWWFRSASRRRRHAARRGRNRQRAPASDTLAEPAS